MSAQEFVDFCGAPSEPIRLDPAYAARFAERVPEELLAFWITQGVGSYADDVYRTCTPDHFDHLLSVLLAQSDELLAADLAAFGYSCLGSMDLWHRSGRHFTYSMDVGLLLDMTSKAETAQPPHDLDTLYSAAGLPMPDNAVEAYLRSRSGPENVWMILMSSASADGYELIEDDDFRPLISLLRTTHGRLSRDEIYFRKDLVGPHTPLSYERLKLSDAQNLLPNSILYSRSIEIDGRSEEVTVRIPVGA